MEQKKMKKRFLLILSLVLLVSLAFVWSLGYCSSTSSCQFLWGSSYSCVNNTCVTGGSTNGSNSSASGLNLSSITANITINITTNLSCTLNSDCLSLGYGFLCVNNTCRNVSTETGSNYTASDITPSFTALTEQVVSLNQSLVNLTQDTALIKNQITNLSSDILTLDSEIKSLKTQQDSLKTTLSQNTQTTNTVSTGLASLQKEVKVAQTNIVNVSAQVGKLEKSRRQTKNIIFAVIGLLAFVAVLAYVFYVHKSRQTPPELKSYLSQSLQANKSYAQIKTELLSAGWPEKLIHSAYKELLAHGYSKYTRSKEQPAAKAEAEEGGSEINAPKMDKQKMIIIGAISLVVIIGFLVLFFQKGLLSGRAIYFGNLTLDEFKASVKDTLKENADKNQFYNYLPNTDFCIQVANQNQSLSYRLIKSAQAFALQEVNVSCEDSSTYDFSVKFTSFDAFSKLAGNAKFTCADLKKAHSAKEVYVLPSRYVLSGFKVNSSEDYSFFCPVLGQCLNSAEMALTGINCTRK